MRSERSGYSVGLLAACLFGASAPFSKLLLDSVDPQLLAGLLYLGAFVAVTPFVATRPRRREAALKRSDLPRLAAIVLTGGVVAPVLLMIGLERVSGVAGSLLLNLEGPLTLVVGVVVMHEYLGRRAAFGTVAIFGGSALIGLRGTDGTVEGLGVLLIGLACLGWALDNNLTQSISGRDPFQIVALKTGVAAAVNIGLALMRGESGASWGVVGGALALGALAYGISILLDAYALRLLGAAREAAIFATAPFAGALVAIPLLGESWSSPDLLAAAAMGVGVALLIADRHDHLHAHEAFDHEHRHVHDTHHDHPHDAGFGAMEPHSHPHRHRRLVHSHPHVSDSHHRHDHDHDHDHDGFDDA